MPTPIILQCASDGHLWALVPAAIGAVLGAAASAIPTFWLAKVSSNEANNRENEQRLQSSRVAATKGMVRLQRITNSLYTMHRQIEIGLIEAQKQGLDSAPLWMQLVPIGGFIIEPIRFEVDELAVLFAAGRAALANDLMLLSERHYANESAMLDYGVKRTALGDLMDPDMQSNIGSTTMTPEKERRFGPRMAELDDAAKHIRFVAKKDMVDAMALMESYSKAMQQHFNDPKFLVFKAKLGANPIDVKTTIDMDPGGPAWMK